MVVVGESDAVAEQVASECSKSLTIGFPLRLAAKLRTLVQRRVDLSLHTVLHLAVHHHLAAVVHQTLEMGADAVDFLVDGRLRQQTGVPAGHTTETVLTEFRLERGRLAR